MSNQAQRAPKFDVMPKEDLKLPPLFQSKEPQGSSSLRPKQPETEKVKELLTNLLS